MSSIIGSVGTGSLQRLLAEPTNETANWCEPSLERLEELRVGHEPAFEREDG